MVVFILLSMGVYAVDIGHGETFDSTSAETRRQGFWIGVHSSDLTLDNVTRWSGDTAVVASVHNPAGELISSAGFVGDTAIFTGVTLNASTTYFVVIGTSGIESTTRYYKNNAATFPLVNSSFNWLASLHISQGASNSSPNINNHTFPFRVKSIGVTNVTPATGSPAPTISSVTCKSCNIPIGDSIEPYTTFDTTPTFNFTTGVEANCRISDEDYNYSRMGNETGGSRDCSDGQGTTLHNCTLPVVDQLVTAVDYAWVACENSATGNQTANSSARLWMDITNLEANNSNAIDNGIRLSKVWPGATVHSNQMVFLRNLNNQQTLATVDRVVIYGYQRWLFNAANDTQGPLGLFNLSPVVYSLDLVNTSFEEIERQVSTLINATKS
jgi:hypothetical protein